MTPTARSEPRPDTGPGPPSRQLPAGFAVTLSARSHLCDNGRSLVGGTAGIVLYLQPVAVGRVRTDRPLRVEDAVGARLARLLLDRGFADPIWEEDAPADRSVTDVTVVIPVRDRAQALDRLLSALPAGLSVIVVDDGSADPRAVAEVGGVHGARVVAHSRNHGPAAARNTGLHQVQSPFVAFCDSDVVPEPGWLGVLRRHLDDPAVAVVAPRVLGTAPGAGDSWLERYEQARSSLDLGPAPAGVRAGGSVSYVPSACLLARVAALGDGFEERMRVGEDVDLIWRLVAAGWGVRYEPAAVVRHWHRIRPLEWMRRKAFYGTSAAPLAARHGSAVAPMVLSGWSAMLVAGLLAQRRWTVALACLGWVAGTVRIARRLRRSEHPLRTGAVLTLEGAVGGLWQGAAVLTRHYWPVAVLAATRSKRARRALLVAAMAEAVADRRRTRARLDPVRYLIARRLDDAAYGVGLWWGVARARSPRALIPRLATRRRPRSMPAPVE